MKTSFCPKVALPVTGLLFAALFVVTAYAGSGPQYWQSKASPKASVSTKPAATEIAVCPSSEVIPITVMKPSLPNGRGALVAVPVGSKRVCHVCPVTTVETTNAWPSHRGPQTKVEVTKAGGIHTCTADCTAPKA